jgi:hypothetical protein
VADRQKAFEYYLEDIQVDPPGMWENHDGPFGWWGVSTGDEGIIAYFYDELSACRFRLAEINRRMNG